MQANCKPLQPALNFGPFQTRRVPGEQVKGVSVIYINKREIEIRGSGNSAF